MADIIGAPGTNPNNAIAAQIRKQSELIASLQAEINNANAHNANLREQGLRADAFAKTLAKTLEDVSGQLDQLKNAVRGDSGSPTRIRTIDDVPGLRTPQWYPCFVDYQAAADQQSFGTVEISPEGPFVITQVQPYWQCLDATVDGGKLYGRYMPISAFPLTVSNGGATTLATFDTNIEEVPEFSLKIQISGSGRFWTSAEKIPGPAFYGVSNPLYTGQMGWVDPTDRIQVYGIPEKAVPHTGKLWIVFHGFQILNNVRLSQYLGQ